nr:MAG TPA: hypothetical protein [Caudoviricetes sp.]
MRYVYFARRLLDFSIVVEHYGLLAAFAADCLREGSQQFKHFSRLYL